MISLAHIGLAGSFGALLVGWLAVVARGLLYRQSVYLLYWDWYQAHLIDTSRVVAGREGLKLISNIHVFFPLLLSLQTLFLLVMAALARSDNTQPAKPMNNIQSPSCINVYSKPLKAAGLRIFSCQAILFYVPRWLWKNWEAGKISALKMDLDQVNQIFKHSYKGLGPGDTNIKIFKYSHSGLEPYSKKYSSIHTKGLDQVQWIFKCSFSWLEQDLRNIHTKGSDQVQEIFKHLHKGL